MEVVAVVNGLTSRADATAAPRESQLRLVQAVFPNLESRLALGGGTADHGRFCEGESVLNHSGSAETGDLLEPEPKLKKIRNNG